MPCSKNIVLILTNAHLDLETYGGIHKKYGAEPDMAMYKKTLGNGYAITAVVGKRSVMELAQKPLLVVLLD